MDAHRLDVLELANIEMRKFSSNQDTPLTDEEEEMFIHGFESAFEYMGFKRAD